MPNRHRIVVHLEPSLPRSHEKPFGWRLTALALGLTCLCLGPGCVYAYQPMSGFHRPIVVDPLAPNFEDLRLTVVCTPGGLLSRDEARMLCDRVGKLFENQGAKVTRFTSDRRSEEGEIGEDAGEEDSALPPEAPPTDLVLELRAREIHSSNDQLSWLLCYATFTLVPAVTESTFVQDVVIRDGNGFLLVSDTLTGRLVRTFGVGTWMGNMLLDSVWREKEDELSGDAPAKKDLSKDLYGQLTQLVFNAKMRWQVLQDAGPARGVPSL